MQRLTRGAQVSDVQRMQLERCAHHTSAKASCMPLGYADDPVQVIGPVSPMQHDTLSDVTYIVRRVHAKHGNHVNTHDALCPHLMPAAITVLRALAKMQYRADA